MRKETANQARSPCRRRLVTFYDPHEYNIQPFPNSVAFSVTPVSLIVLSSIWVFKAPIVSFSFRKKQRRRRGCTTPMLKSNFTERSVRFRKWNDVQGNAQWFPFFVEAVQMTLWLQLWTRMFQRCTQQGGGDGSERERMRVVLTN